MIDFSAARSYCRLVVRWSQAHARGKVRTPEGATTLYIGIRALFDWGRPLALAISSGFPTFGGKALLNCMLDSIAHAWGELELRNHASNRQQTTDL
jgi:hypothetical protein